MRVIVPADAPYSTIKFEIIDVGDNDMGLDIHKLVDKYQLNQTEEKILLYIIDNIESVKEIGVRGIAKEFYTSTTTIMNLAKKLGHTGFLDMYYQLYFTLKDKKSHFAGGKNSQFYGVDLEQLLSLIDHQQIDEFVNLLLENKNEIIYTWGGGFSTPITEYITRKLIVLGFKCIFSEPIESYDVNPIQAKLFITVSKSGETDSLLRMSHAAKKNGIKIISITGDPENSLSKLADQSLKLVDMNTMDDRNKSASSFYANVLMLFEFLIGEYLERIKDESTKN